MHICKNTKTVEEVPELLYPLSGRFALFIEINGQLFVFHDPCGFRRVTYTKTDKGLFFGSDEQIINEVTTLRKGEKYAEYEKSELKQENEAWIFAGASLYEDVYKLIANHYLKADTLTQLRYFPSNKLLNTNDIECIANKSIEILTKTFSALKHREIPLAFGATAGRDSRLLMAFLDDTYIDIFYYTLSFGNDNHFDIRVPAKILKKRGIQHHIFDCNRTHPAPSYFKDIYMNNSTMAHADMCNLAYGVDKYYPVGRLSIRGVASEIVRGFYHPTPKAGGFVSNYDDFVNKVGLNTQLKLSFNKSVLKKWFDEAKILQDNLDIPVLDLFYWEHRVGSWQAQAQLERDITHESYSPFNNRELLVTMLTLHNDYREKFDNKLYKKIIEKQFPFLLRFSYDNEGNIKANLFKKLKRFIKKILKHLGTDTNSKNKDTIKR